MLGNKEGFVPPVSLLSNEMRAKKIKKAAQVSLSASCKKLEKPCAVLVFLHRAGAHAEQRVSRAPAHQAGSERDDADVAPDRQNAGDGGADQAEAGNDTKDFVDTANIAFHGCSPLSDVYSPHFNEAFIRRM